MNLKSIISRTTNRHIAWTRPPGSAEHFGGQTSVALLILAIVLPLLGGCATNPATGRQQLQFLSAQEEIAMGNEAMPGLIAEYGGLLPNQSVREYVTSIGNDLAQYTEADYPGYPWEFIVLNSEVVNAFALPGGKVFISRGLLTRLTDEAQLAGVLGHEIGHVVAEHVDERLSRQMLLELGISIAGAVTESELAIAAADLFSNGYILHFGRSQESESDILALRYMSKAGYDPAAMLNVLEVLASLSEGPRQPEFLSTHPHPETRMETVTAELASNYANAGTDANLQRHRDRFERNVLRLID